MNKKIISMVILAVFISTGVYAASMDSLQEISNALDKRKQSLDARERAIKVKEDRLKAMQDSVMQKDVEVRKMQTAVTARLKEIKVQEDKNLDKLAKDYNSARPKNAAMIIVKMDMDKAVQLFQRLPAMTAGNIISAMGQIDPVYAAQLSEKFTPAAIPGVTAPLNIPNAK